MSLFFGLDYYLHARMHTHTLTWYEEEGTSKWRRNLMHVELSVIYIFQSIWLWRPVGTDCRISTRLEGRDFSLQEHSQNPTCTSITVSIFHSVMSSSFRSHGLKPPKLLCPWDFPSKSTVVGCSFLFQGSSWNRDPIYVSCISRQILYHWAPRDPWKCYAKYKKGFPGGSVVKSVFAV